MVQDGWSDLKDVDVQILGCAELGAGGFGGFAGTEILRVFVFYGSDGTRRKIPVQFVLRDVLVEESVPLSALRWDCVQRWSE